MIGLTQNTKSLQARIVAGSIVLLSGSGMATAINLAYNISLARFLGPIGFGHATVVYTILTLISAVTLSFQIITTKVVAQQDSAETKSSVYRAFHYAAWGCGLLVALGLTLFRGSISDYLNLPAPSLVALLAIGAAFYVPLGSRRGFIQGTYGFRGLATNLVLEGAIRLGGSLLAIALGLGVQGVIAANALAIAVAYAAIQPKLSGRLPNPLRFSYTVHETLQALVFFSGQVLINNCDIVLVKHYFPPRTAGLYAAVAMVGRVIYSFSSAVVNSMFPLVAGTREEERKDLTVIATSLLLVLGVGSALALGLYVAPAWLWTRFFGAGFDIVGKHNMPYLLALYAITTVIYSLSVVVITFEMSYKIANSSYIQLAFSGVLILAIARWHSTLTEVIMVQLIMMMVLLVFVAVPFLASALSVSHGLLPTGEFAPLRVVRRLSEDEVIAEFLKSDFHSPAFRDYRESLGPLVSHPNLENADENAKRRALLFLRHLALWKEIPTDTEWYELHVDERDLDQIRVFPRAQWRKLGKGNFSIAEILKNMRARKDVLDGAFLAKIDAIRESLLHDDLGPRTVILIGLNETEPVTVLDGNHRLVSSVLQTPSTLDSLRYVCGFSPRMGECCWYNTNLTTLMRYGRNVLKHVVRDPEAELARLLQSTG
ncbi:MAG TPA: lipopolysaccharide biosynthesis protein [Terracidiphilus sp.]